MVDRAAHDIEIVDGIVVYDLGRGRTATHVIAAVVEDLAGRPIMYRDATGTFDGVELADGCFGAFYPIGERVLEAAIEAEQRHCDEQSPKHTPDVHLV